MHSREVAPPTVSQLTKCMFDKTDTFALPCKDPPVSCSCHFQLLHIAIDVDAGTVFETYSVLQENGTRVF